MSKIDNFKKDSLSFDVDAQLIGELGERLVSKNHIGISELIKNSYDADSPSVQVTLTNVKNSQSPDSQLTITDFGSGMTFEVVEQHWMTIGTSNKRRNRTSEVYGRPVTGNKGIGRFACQRLAESLELITCAKRSDGSYDHTKVYFKWDDFTPGKRLSRVFCDYEYYSSPEGIPGTTLKLRGLRDKVTDRDFNMLLKSVSLVSVTVQVKRDGYIEDPGFEASISAPEFEYLMGDNQFLADEKILSSGWGTLAGKISRTGQVEFSLESLGSKKQSYVVKSDLYPDLAGINFTIYIIPLKTRDDIENRRVPSLMNSHVTKGIRDYYSGIKLYLNGFRVYPYGDVIEGDDWLGISRDIGRRRGPTDFPELLELASNMGIPHVNRAMLNHPGARSLIGSVEIEGEATDAFEVKMDREGLVETGNFRDLKKLIRLALDWTTFNYESWLHRSRNERHREVAKKFEKSLGESFEDDKSRFLKAIETLDSNKQLESALTVASEIKKKEILKPIDFKTKDSKLTPKENNNEIQYDNQKEQLDTAKKYAISQYQALDAEVELLRAVSATAPLLFVFAHEVKGIAHTLLSQSAELKSVASQISDESIRGKLLGMADSATYYKKSFDNLFELFDVFSDSSSNTARKISYKNLFDRVKTGFSFFTKQYNIELTFNEVNPIWKVPRLNQAEAYSVLINLLSNSIKSLIASNSNKRCIHISISRDENSYYMSVMDNGIGLAVQHWEKVFEARVYDPESKLYSSVSSELTDEQLSNLGKGSGLGLNIVRNILRKHKGTVNFVQPSEGWSAEVKVIIGN